MPQNDAIMEELTLSAIWLDGVFAERSARADAHGIAMDMGLRRPRLLSRAEAAELAYSPALAHLSRGERLSFRKADILIEAADESGEPCYVAVEASYTADERDTEPRASQRRVAAPRHRPPGPRRLRPRGRPRPPRRRVGRRPPA